MADRLKLDDLQSYGGPLPSTSSSPAREQRQSPRALLEIDAAVAMDGAMFQARTIDISVGGLCIEAARQLPVGKDCQLSFELPPAGGAHSRHPILVQASVIYCFYTGEDEFKVGLEFLDLTPAGADDIKSFIAS